MTRPVPPRPGPGALRARLAEILRVDQAGELAAVHIYRGQAAVMRAAPGRERIADQLKEMEGHEQVHLSRFNDLLTERQVRPTLMSPLWRAAAHYASVFELGRFVGRVDRGAKALLPSYHQEAMEQVLAGLPIGQDAELATMHDNIRSAVETHFGVVRFQKLLEEARRTGGVIAVDRQSRRLRCRTDVGLSARVHGRS